MHSDVPPARGCVQVEEIPAISEKLVQAGQATQDGLVEDLHGHHVPVLLPLPTEETKKLHVGPQ